MLFLAYSNLIKLCISWFVRFFIKISKSDLNFGSKHGRCSSNLLKIIRCPLKHGIIFKKHLLRRSSFLRKLKPSAYLTKKAKGNSLLLCFKDWWNCQNVLLASLTGCFQSFDVQSLNQLGCSNLNSWFNILLPRFLTISACCLHNWLYYLKQRNSQCGDLKWRCMQYVKCMLYTISPLFHVISHLFNDFVVLYKFTIRWTKCYKKDINQNSKKM